VLIASEEEHRANRSGRRESCPALRKKSIVPTVPEEENRARRFGSTRSGTKIQGNIPNSNSRLCSRPGSPHSKKQTLIPSNLQPSALQPQPRSTVSLSSSVSQSSFESPVPNSQPRPCSHPGSHSKKQTLIPANLQPSALQPQPRSTVSLSSSVSLSSFESPVPNSNPRLCSRPGSPHSKKQTPIPSDLQPSALQPQPRSTGPCPTLENVHSEKPTRPINRREPQITAASPHPSPSSHPTHKGQTQCRPQNPILSRPPASITLRPPPSPATPGADPGSPPKPKPSAKIAKAV